MWISFLACIILCAIVLYVPGYLLFRNLAFSTPRSIAFAPIASTAIISIVAIVNEKIGIFSAGSTVFGPTLVLCFIPYLIAKLIGHAKTTDRATSWDWKFLACYAAFGILICVYMFIKPLDGADSFYCRADNATHLNMVRYFVESRAVVIHWRYNWNDRFHSRKCRFLPIRLARPRSSRLHPRLVRSHRRHQRD